MTIPRKLYKFRRFDVRALKMVTDHGLYYSKPRDFNDPLDCDLSIVRDLSPAKLAELLRHLHGEKNRSSLARSFAAILREGAMLGDLKTDKVAKNFVRMLMTDMLSEEIKKEFDARGVLSFASKWDSVLMWSHYADQHRGVCFEFDTSELPHDQLMPIQYHSDRSVRASDIFSWKIENDEEAAQRIFKTHFYSKAPDWEYEGEWRDVADNAGECGDYRITGIYFGYRCEHAVKVAVAKMLGLDTKVELYQVTMKRRSYELERTPVDASEIHALGMREPFAIEAAALADSFDELEEMT